MEACLQNAQSSRASACALGLFSLPLPAWGAEAPSSRWQEEKAGGRERKAGLPGVGDARHKQERSRALRGCVCAGMLAAFWEFQMGPGPLCRPGAWATYCLPQPPGESVRN